MTSITIRPALEADTGAVSRLALRLASFPVPRWRTADEIINADARAMVRAIAERQAGSEVFIADDCGTAAGCLHMVSTQDFFGRRHAHVSVIAVSEAAEGTGIGRALMSFAEDWSRERGFPFITLNVFAANARARRFYEKTGYDEEVVKYAKVL